MTTSAERMRVHRGHRNGDHSECNYQRCKARQDLEYEAEERCFTLAVFAELKRMGIKPQDFFGVYLDDARAKAGKNFSDWLPQEPDAVTRLQARSAIAHVLAEEAKAPEPEPVEVEPVVMLKPMPKAGPDYAPVW